MFKKDILFVVLVTFCLTAALFMVSSSVGYDPWADTNDDGKIDMKDIGYTAKLFGTSGDSTKNVTVTNWPTRPTLNATLADHLAIPDGDTVYLYANVDGYNKATLVLDKHTSGTLWLMMNYQIGGVYTPLIYSNNSLSSGKHFLLRSHEVIGPTIMIELVAVGSEQIVSLGIYASD